MKTIEKAFLATFFTLCTAALVGTCLLLIVSLILQRPVKMIGASAFALFAILGTILSQYSLHKLEEGHVGVYYRVSRAYRPP